MRWWVISLVVALAGCASSRPASESPLDPAMSSSPLVGQRWELRLIGTDQYWRGEQPAYFTLSPDNGQLRLIGSNGCNRLVGEVLLGEGQRIDFGNLASTRMACPGTPQAAQVNAMLSQAYRYLIDHNRLVFFGPDSLVLGAFKH